MAGRSPASTAASSCCAFSLSCWIAASFCSFCSRLQQPELQGSMDEPVDDSSLAMDCLSEPWELQAAHVAVPGGEGELGHVPMKLQLAQAGHALCAAHHAARTMHQPHKATTYATICRYSAAT
jgi:hypothetical protein